MKSAKAGRIVWHDLFTKDRPRSMAFYQRVAGWSYATEHAPDFAWGGGEKDFVLAFSEGEAGAGFAETPLEQTDGWIAYVEVSDVDVSAALAAQLGGAVVVPPFEVPGVGRNSLLRDPLGALVGISLSRHEFPLPVRQFGIERYLSEAMAFPEEFYVQLFGWNVIPSAEAYTGSTITSSSGEEVAVQTAAEIPMDTCALWVPSIKAVDSDVSLREAEALGAESFIQSSEALNLESFAFLRDPNGARFSLVKAQE